MTNKVFKRFSAISHQKNTDSSDEYYTLFHAFAELLIELLCRYKDGIKYKVIICPCDSNTSIFRELEKYKDLIGNPLLVYSSYPDKSWEEYFNMDYQKEYGCNPDDVLIFTNPPFYGLSKRIREISCHYLLFGSNAVSIKKGVFLKETKGFIYIKNNQDYTGDADERPEKYGAVHTCFYSDEEFRSYGKVFINSSNTGKSLLFGRYDLDKVKED